MIQVTVLYPHGPAFDMEYYLTRHTPMLRARFGAALKGLEIDHITACIAPGGAPPYQVICRLAFDTLGTVQSLLEAHGAEILGDIPNYTQAQPVIVAGDVK